MALGPEEGLDRERRGVDLQRAVLAQEPFALVAVGAGQRPVSLLVQQMTREEAAAGLASRRADVARGRYRELERYDADVRHRWNGARREFDPRKAPFSVGGTQPAPVPGAASIVSEWLPSNAVLRSKQATGRDAAGTGNVDHHPAEFVGAPEIELDPRLPLGRARAPVRAWVFVEHAFRLMTARGARRRDSVDSRPR